MSGPGGIVSKAAGMLMAMPDLGRSAVARDASGVHPIDEHYADQDHQGHQQVPVVQALLIWAHSRLS
jgi:hypothetical protein